MKANSPVFTIHIVVVNYAEARGSLTFYSEIHDYRMCIKRKLFKQYKPLTFWRNQQFASILNTFASILTPGCIWVHLWSEVDCRIRSRWLSCSNNAGEKKTFNVLHFASLFPPGISTYILLSVDSGICCYLKVL